MNGCWAWMRRLDAASAGHSPEEQNGRHGGAQQSRLGRVLNTKPSHELSDYVGEYDHPAYGTLKISMKDNALRFDFHKIGLPLAHFHYDRFDSADDEEEGKWSINFSTNPQGDVDKATVSLDEGEVVFVRRAAKLDEAVAQRTGGEL
jgi:hypothetical protein